MTIQISELLLLVLSLLIVGYLIFISLLAYRLLHLLSTQSAENARFHDAMEARLKTLTEAVLSLKESPQSAHSFDKTMDIDS